jgi:hypothetical protein
LDHGDSEKGNERKIKEVSMYDIVNIIMTARGHAEIFAQQRPEVAEPVKRLEEDLVKAHKTFIDAVVPIT